MINKVFCYSDEVAKKNGIKKEIIYKLILMAIIFIIMICLVLVFSSYSFLILLVGFFIIIFISIKLASNYSMAKLIGYAIDNEGNLLQVIMLNHIDNVSTSGNILGQSVGGNFGQSVGIFSDSMDSANRLNKNMLSMSDPEFVLNAIKNAHTSENIQVFKFEKVYSIIDKKTKIMVKCDRRFIKNNKLYKKKIIITKSYTMFDELVNCLKKLNNSYNIQN